MEGGRKRAKDILFSCLQTSSLRLLCESQLVAKIQDKTVFQLLVAADQFSATQLRVCVIL